jgi:hypothetical protein
MFGWLLDLIIAGLNSSVTTGCPEGLTPRRSGLASLDAHHLRRLVSLGEMNADT